MVDRGAARKTLEPSIPRDDDAREMPGRTLLRRLTDPRSRKGRLRRDQDDTPFQSIEELGDEDRLPGARRTADEKYMGTRESEERSELSGKLCGPDGSGRLCRRPVGHHRSRGRPPPDPGTAGPGSYPITSRGHLGKARACLRIS